MGSRAYFQGFNRTNGIENEVVKDPPSRLCVEILSQRGGALAYPSANLLIIW